MSWYSKAKAFGASALAATQEAAKIAAAATSAVVEDLKAPPTTVKCSGCQAILQVPPEVFSWLCQTPSCLSRGLSYPLSTKVCAECKQPQPELPPPEIACGVCNAHTIVPTSKFIQGLNAAKETTVEIASKTAEYTSKTIDNLRSVPAVVKCGTCNVDVAVPPTIFDDCPDDTPPTVRCAACNLDIPVPRSNASKHLNSAARVTQEAAKKTSAYVSKTYEKMKAAPTEFHCEHCNACLRLEGINPDDFKGNVMLTCGSCNRATSVPKNNFMNLLRGSTASTTRSVVKAYYLVSKKPHVVCTTCGFHVKIPEIKDEKAPATEQEAEDSPKRDTIACPKCHTELQPQALPQAKASPVVAAPSPVVAAPLPAESDQPPAYSAAATDT